MKLKINKACDLSSISVLPPHARRTSAGPSGAESSFGKIQTSHFRSQQSQQSLSQGVSSQPAIFSQLSQNSLDEIVTSEQSSGHNDIKASLEGVSKSMSEELRQNLPQENFREISSVVSALPDEIETCIVKLQDDLKKSLMEEIQAVACSLKVPFQKYKASITPPEVEKGSWKSARHKRANKNGINSNKRHNKDSLSGQQEMEQRVTVASDDDSDGGFSCLLNEKESGSGNYTMDDSKEDIERMLRKARRKRIL